MPPFEGLSSIRTFPPAGTSESRGHPTTARRTTLGLIRFGGHLPRGGYDVDHGRPEPETGPAQLHRGVQGQAERDDGTRPGLTTSEREELGRLRKEVRELRMERDVLKKATAFFAKDHL